MKGGENVERNILFDLFFTNRRVVAKEEEVELHEYNNYKPYAEYLEQNLTGELLERFRDFKNTHETFWTDLYDINCSRMLFIGMNVGMKYQEYIDELDGKV